LYRNELQKRGKLGGVLISEFASDFSKKHESILVQSIEIRSIPPEAEPQAHQPWAEDVPMAQKYSLPRDPNDKLPMTELSIVNDRLSIANQ